MPSDQPDLENKSPLPVPADAWQKWAGLALVFVAFAFAAALTWRKWPDLIIDFGTQLYIPWRLAHGAVLYRDIYYFAGGPLSQYFNALLFKIFGVSFGTLIAANLTLTAGLLVFIYRRFLAAADAWTATMICLGIVLVFAFSEYTACGNYNYAAPYSHEILHGVAGCIFGVGFLANWLAGRKRRQILGAGFCAGLVFLTKPDLFLALAAGALAALALDWFWRRNFSAVISAAGWFALGMAPPLIFFFLFFLRVESWRESFRSVTFGWQPLFEPAIRNNPFYRQFAGLDQPLMHLREMAMQFGCAMLVVLLCAVIFRCLNRLRPVRESFRWVLWIVLVYPLLVLSDNYSWITCGSSLPLWCGLTLALLAWNFKKISTAEKNIFPFLWTFVALLITAKMGLFPRIWHYGFALAMPAFVSAIYLLMWLLPRWLEKYFHAPARFLRAALSLLLLLGFALLFARSLDIYRIKTFAVGSAGDQILSYQPPDETGEDFAAALAWIRQNVPPDNTLAVVPEGVALNYLSRRPNPTPCIFWDPNIMALFGQEKMTASFERSPPDYIFIVERNASDLGVGYFGQSPGYGVELMQWVRRNYQAVQLIGNEPLKDGRFGIEIFKRTGK